MAMTSALSLIKDHDSECFDDLAIRSVERSEKGVGRILVGCVVMTEQLEEAIQVFKSDTNMFFSMSAVKIKMMIKFIHHLL